MTAIPITRTQLRLGGDPRRIITKPFVPGGEPFPEGDTRVERILARILAMPEAVVSATLNATYEAFQFRHLNLTQVLEDSFANVARYVSSPDELGVERRRLIGAYFTQEYAVEAAALSNPSIVPSPRQDGASDTTLRFIMSLRAIGEGHVSSIQFRSGCIDRQGQVMVDAVTPFVTTARHRPPVYDKPTFRAKLEEMHSLSDAAALILDPLEERFTMGDLEAVIRDTEAHPLASEPDIRRITRTMHWLASSNYESTFDVETAISERVLFPAGPTESQGMEDARFVRFVYEDGRVTYFATYTAFDGFQILPQLIETKDFVSFRISTLNGRAAANKGIALFPRKIDGHFVALGRIDNENNHVMRSDNVRFWFESRTLQSPTQPWELTQLGNCGSPLETEAGWLVITHGVGPLRGYAIGAILLDLQDPTRVIGRLKEPLLSPLPDERDGYVPNVVYSCGALVSNGLLVLPYGCSDVAARIATLRVDDLLRALTAP